MSQEQSCATLQKLTCKTLVLGRDLIILGTDIGVCLEIRSGKHLLGTDCFQRLWRLRIAHLKEITVDGADVCLYRCPGLKETKVCLTFPQKQSVWVQ